MQSLSSIPLSLVFLVATIVIAVGTAVYVALAARERQATLDRVAPVVDADRIVERLLLSSQPTRASRLAGWLSEQLPSSFSEGGGNSKLIQAGFDGAAAPVLFTGARMAAGLFFPVLAFVLAPRTSILWVVGITMLGVLIGIAGPQAILDRLVTARQLRVRRAVPDALDLLVVCVEAGISLDAALLRVSRDMAALHPDLCLEMAQVVRRVGAGMQRDKALQGMYARTGVEEIRTLVSSMIQCERLGTSIARVLRINAESLRMRRRQYAEKRAAEAALKMIFPLALFLLPALMVIIVGPAFIEIRRQLGALGGG
ncbi:MAG: type II secretion system F family protein [Gemmatimonadota bacterium]